MLYQSVLCHALIPSSIHMDPKPGAVTLNSISCLEEVLPFDPSPKIAVSYNTLNSDQDNRHTKRSPKLAVSISSSANNSFVFESKFSVAENVFATSKSIHNTRSGSPGTMRIFLG